MEKYVIIQWPEIQDFIDKLGFDSHSYLINDDKGIEDFGSGAYFVEENWYNRVKRLNNEQVFKG